MAHIDDKHPYIAIILNSFPEFEQNLIKHNIPKT
jgi:hypothetical protein